MKIRFQFIAVLTILLLRAASLHAGTEEKIEPVISKPDRDFMLHPLYPPKEIKPTLLELFMEHATLSSYVKEEMAFRVIQPLTFTKVMTVFQNELSYEIGGSASLYSRFFTYYDAVYDGISADLVSPTKGPEVVLSDAPAEDEILLLDIKNIRDIQYRNLYAELKEFFLEVHFENVDLRIGRQIVRWGVVEGSRVTDEINPLDMGEFILREIADRYIPLWMLKADYYLDEETFTLILIPDIRFHQPAQKQTEWEQFTFLDNLVFPGKNFQNTEVAIKISKYLFDMDMNLSYFYTWDDFPVAFRTLLNAGKFGTSPDVEFRPVGDRLHILGITASRSIGKFIVNTEAAYVKGKFFGSEFDVLEARGGTVFGGEIEKDYIKYALSVDFVFLGFDLSLQGIEQYIIRYDSRILVDRLDTIFGLFTRRELMDNRLVPSLLIIHFQNNVETLYRPKIDYSITDQIKITAGIDILTGHIVQTKSLGKFNFVGFFTNNDRLYFEVKYSF